MNVCTASDALMCSYHNQLFIGNHISDIALMLPRRNHGQLASYNSQEGKSMHTCCGQDRSDENRRWWNTCVHPCLLDPEDTTSTEDCWDRTRRFHKWLNTDWTALHCNLDHVGVMIIINILWFEVWPSIPALCCLSQRWPQCAQWARWNNPMNFWSLDSFGKIWVGSEVRNLKVWKQVVGVMDWRSWEGDIEEFEGAGKKTKWGLKLVR